MNIEQKIAAFMEQMSCEYCEKTIDPDEHPYHRGEPPFYLKEAEDNIVITVFCPHAFVNGSHSQTFERSDMTIKKDKLLEIRENEGCVFNYGENHKASYSIEISIEILNDFINQHYSNH